MSGKIILRIQNGMGSDREIVFQDRTLCTVGRAEECFLQFPYLEISRRHCLLDIDPPIARIRDLGSRNGTFVNGERIGQRPKGQSPEDVLFSMEERNLEDGDEILLGSVVLKVNIGEASQALGTEKEPECVGV